MSDSDALRQETLVETFYRFQAGRFVTVSPDLQFVLDVLWNTTDEGLFAEKERQAAWQLLTRIASDEEEDLRNLAIGMDASGGQPDIRALQQAITDLHALPKTAEQLDWYGLLQAWRSIEGMVGSEFREEGCFKNS